MNLKVIGMLISLSGAALMSINDSIFSFIGMICLIVGIYTANKGNDSQTLKIDKWKAVAFIISACIVSALVYKFWNVNNRILMFILQILCLSLLFSKDRNNGEKELFIAQRWNVYHVATIILIFNVMTYVMVYIAKAVKNETVNLDVAMFMWTVYAILMAVLVLVVFKFAFKVDIGLEILGFNRNGLSKKAILMGAIPSILLSAPFIAYSIISGETFRIQQVTRYDFLILLAFLVVVIIPVMESCFWRGICYSPFRKKFGPAMAITINAILYASVSAINGGEFLVYLFPGLLFCYLYERTENMYTNISASCIYSLIALVFR
ncbi:MAG: CPBP family intramembrane metalloprotease [Nitrospirae bacterium]|nr:CPBP family intramembrane metalloprotease [Nitrospirota bacterium]